MGNVSPQEYGAIGDGIVDDTAAIDLWLSEILTQKHSGRLDGVYRYRPTSPWNLGGKNFGVTIEGKRRNYDGFFLDPGYSLSIYADGDVFYPLFSNFRIAGYFAGPLVRVGKNDFSDAVNSMIWDGIVINNGSQSVSNIGLMCNHVCNSFFRSITINSGCSGRPADVTGMAHNPYAPGCGNALRLRQTQFSSFSGSFANANIGILITDGYSFSNSFEDFDIEEVDTCLYVNSQFATKNDFRNGQMLGKVTFDCPSGKNFVNKKSCNIQNYSCSGASLGNVAGIELY
ncbi:hypothetical protein LPB79_13265 [Rhizobium sp. T136]|uniref:hypothetical protein n=1 Tax=Rhizobium sp. T136 TaxID=555319 RepID=UPI001E482C3C|nr:hypothetical protein [Rhizobium sp. T136]UFS83217.1 hypothetical protein LPB79_13265 [Rhizobium sp. T136]